jgi:hypothetical protein
MLAVIGRRCVGRLVCGMANESFDNLVTRQRTRSAMRITVGDGKMYTVLCGHLNYGTMERRGYC